ncbi:exopolyphosphatase [Microbacteriaceae bacterium VKM Ac-2855]|nr:exopolyphosphatase [Microbacteriaceae bacterium VKM Ac-2855]
MTRVAAIDCGTNSLRLLVADADGGRLAEVRRRTEIVRLGQGVDRTGRFDPEALRRTLAVTAEYAATIRELGAERIRFVATSATRDAADREEFLDAVERLLAVRPETIAGTEEAALSFRGAVSAVDTEQPVLVVDLGGGSTELVLGEPLHAHSMDVGCVRLTERHGANADAMRADVRAALAASSVDLSAARAVIGVAATVLTITAHALRLATLDRDALDSATLSFERMQAACADILKLSTAELAALPYVRAGREDVLGAGAVIWSEVLGAVAGAGPVREVTVTLHDILDGVALSLADPA